MNRSIFYPLAAALVLSGCAGVATGPGAQRIELLGTPVTGQSAVLASPRTITITPETRWINVTSGDTVRFIVGEQTFAWNFQVSATITSFYLNQVAPPGMLARQIPVFVAPNPLYISNS